MKQEQVNYKVNLIGEQDLSKLSADEMVVLIAAYIDGLRKYLSLPDSQAADAK